MKDELKEKREDRADKEKSLNLLVEKAAKEKLTADENKQFDALEAEIEELDKDIKRLEKIEAKSKEKAKKAIEEGAGALPGGTQDDASEDKELLSMAKKFLLSKAIMDMAEEKALDGVEKEIHSIARKEAKESGVKLSTGKNTFCIPSRLIKLGSRKALTVGTEGADVVFTEYGGKVIPYLNPQPVADELGVTFLQGLRGNLQWPRETGDLAFSWETETGAVDETTPTYDNVAIAPKRFGGYLDVTQQMLKQSVFVLNPMIVNKLNLRYALTVDSAIFNGSGAGNQPTGLFNMGGVNVLSLGSGSANDMTYRALLSMKRDTKVANSRVGRAGWVTNANGEFALYATPKQASGVEGNFILNADRPGTLLSETFKTSEIIPSNFSEGGQTDLCGIAYSPNWGGLFAGFWGGMELLIDPYTQALAGTLRFVVNAFMDVDVEQPLEYAICKDWDATDLPAVS